MNKQATQSLDRASFICSLPEIKSAIIIGSDGMQVKLEIPETYKQEGMKLGSMTGKQLRATIEVVEKEMRPHEHAPGFEDPYDGLMPSDAVSKPKRSIEVK